MPTMLGHPQWRPLWVLACSSVCFVVWSFFENRRRGPIAETELASILNASALGRPACSEQVRDMIRSRRITPWPRQQDVDYERTGIPRETAWYAHPTTFEVAAGAVLVVLMIWWW